MKTIYDIQQLLKRFGTIIYIGDRVADLELMEEEVKQLFESQLIDAKEFEMAMLLLRREIMIEKDKRKRVKDENYDR
ncbi:YqgQ family protein [Aeribacillus sp. FSL K6-1121]|uniref:YqgQ family protein n=1 Tax=Aeribacillus sp. FSL K6-1121 TaxID=2954745 RepID=UPI0030F8242B